MRAQAALPRALVLVAAFAFSGCGFLAGIASEGDDADSGAPHEEPHRPDGGRDDGGNDGGGSDAGPLDAGADDDAGLADAGRQDAGPLDAGPLEAGYADAGDEDAGDEDAGDEDAGEPDGGLDAGEPPLPDAGPVDGGPTSPAIVLAQGHGITTTQVVIDPADLAAVDSVLLFLARENTNSVSIPGDWSGPEYASHDDEDGDIVGATRWFQDPPTALPTEFPIAVKSGERFSYALIGVAGLGQRRNDFSREGDSDSSSASCGENATAVHRIKRSFPFYAVAGLAHRHPRASVAPPGTLLARVEPEAGPSLLVQELEGPANTDVDITACLTGSGAFVSVVQAYELP